jgi:hypothetical protein
MKFLIAVLMTACTIVVVGRQVTRAADWTPATPPSIYPVDAGPNAVPRNDFIVEVCDNDAELDCVESIAAYINDSWVEGVPTSTVNPGPGGVDGSRDWTIPGLVNLNGSNNTVTVIHRVNYTGNLFLQTSIRASGSDGDRDTTGLPRDTKFRATVRTSWVLPTHVSGKMSAANIAVTKLSASGASRVMMEGIPLKIMVISDDSQLTSPTGRGDYETREFSMTVSDGRYYPIKQACIEKPAIMTSENGYGHPLPTFTNGNLDLKVSAPHFLSDGTTEHAGYYEAAVPLEMATCLWGSAITTASTFDVEVFETEGSTKAATRTTDVTEAAVLIKATSFTFSSPTIRVSYTAPAPSTSSSSSSTSSSTSSTSSSASSSPATTTPQTPPTPKPTGVKLVGGKAVGTITFTRVAGTTYAVVATKRSARKTFRCTKTKSKVACRATGLSRGIWKVTVTPKRNGTSGVAYTGKLRIS